MESLTTYIEEMPLRDGSNIVTAEKMIYQICQNDPYVGNIELWDFIMMELAKFHAMCGNNMFRHLAKQWDIYLDITDFIHRCNGPLTIPYHNAVAFFQRFITLDIPKKHQQHLLQSILPYALSCRGFVFGTAFDREGVKCIRPCDMDYIEPFLPDPAIWKNILMSQAQLNSGYNFMVGTKQCQRVLFEISNETRYIESWLERYRSGEDRYSDDFSEPWSRDIDKWEIMFWDFFNYYQTYCISQISGANEYKRKEIKEQLCWIESSACFIFKMERLSQRLEAIKKISDRQQNICEKQRWLSDIKNELFDESTVKELDALQKTSGKIIPPSLEGRSIYGYILCPEKLSKQNLDNYPLLDENIAMYKLKNPERSLYWYRKHPIAQTIDLLCRGPRRKILRKVLPFYLLNHFIHKEKPLRPFTRKIHHFYPDKLVFSGDISFCEHPNAKRLQECHYSLYQFLVKWCNCYFPKEWDRKLCNALYTFHRPHLITSEPSADTAFLKNNFARLRDSVSQSLDIDVSALPQYTEHTISANEFYQFFYIDTTPKVKKLREVLQKLVTSEIADQYKELAFLAPDGLGYSLHSKGWHQNMAEFLSNVISKDECVLQYVDESSTPNLAQVELAIQFICCQKIQEKMTQDVLCYCKKILGPG